MVDNRALLDFDENKVDLVLSRIDRGHLPGAAVGVAIDGTPVFRKGFGLASVDLPIGLSTSMKLRIGSTTKHFASLAFLLLCEDGLVDPDEDVRTYLPELSNLELVPTYRQLMSHTSGIRDVHDLCYQFSGIAPSVSSAALVAQYIDIGSVNFDPGASWLYCNGGYVLLSAAIERISGLSLDLVLRDRIFSRVGMWDSALRRTDDGFSPNSATLHMPDGKGAYSKSYLGTAFSGEGGVVSTVDDLLRWLRHMDEPIVGSPATWAALKGPSTLTSGIATGYGFGLMHGHVGGLATLFHSGGVLAGTSEMLKIPELGLDVVVLTNAGDISATELAHDIINCCVRVGVPGASPPFHPPITAHYISRDSRRVVQLTEREGQQILTLDGMEMTAERRVDGSIWPSGVWSFLQQAIIPGDAFSEKGPPQLSDFGRTEPLEKIVEGAPRSVLSRNGTYTAVGAPVKASVVESGTKLGLMTHGRFGSVEYNLEPIGENIYRATTTAAEFLGGIVDFDALTDSFHFTSYRTRRLKFVKSGARDAVDQA